MRTLPLFGRLFLLSCTLLMAEGASAQSALRMPAIFSDHMVVQRDQPIRVWGWGAPGDTLRVELSTSTGNAVVDPDGRWMAELPELPAGGPFRLSVAGSDSLVFDDVLVGDVWLAGGQSNMEWPVVASNDADAVIAAASDPQLRLFTVERGFAATPAEDVVSSGWHPTTPNTVREFSAVAYHFGQQLRREVGVPIGLLESNWGGSAAEAWMSADMLSTHSDFASLASEMLQGSVSPVSIYEERRQAFEEALLVWSDAVRELDAGYTIEGPVWAQPSFVPADWDTMQIPQALEEGGLADFDGIVWFRRSIEVPAAWAGQPARLEFGLVDDADSTWVNGVLLGAAADTGMRGACLLGELPHLFAQLPFPKASLAVLEAFMMMTGIELDTSGHCYVE